MEKQDARTRLRDAALELFRERGYDRTTAAEIAARAGVTERTFFRYYPDKREVLFDGEAMVQATLVASVAKAPAGLEPLEVLFSVFRAFKPMLAERWAYAKPRQEVIAATAALQERELAKVDALADALALALEARGVTTLSAYLAARVGVAAFVHATIGCLEDPEKGLVERLDLAQRELEMLLVSRP